MADEREWEVGWDGHLRAQRRRLARLSLAEKLDWLEEAHRFVMELEAAKARARADRPREKPESEPEPGA